MVRLISISNFVTIRCNICGNTGGKELAKYLLGGGQDLGEARWYLDPIWTNFGQSGSSLSSPTSKVFHLKTRTVQIVAKGVLPWSVSSNSGVTLLFSIHSHRVHIVFCAGGSDTIQEVAKTRVLCLSHLLMEYIDISKLVPDP